MPTHNPIRCFEGNAKPHEPFWKWVNIDSPTPEMEIDGVISEYSWYDDDITPKLFKDQLYKNGKGGPVLMKLSSPGGDVIAAAKMRDIMTAYPGDITVQVNGMAASAAVMVAISGKTLQITDSSYMMIHDPAVVVFLAMLDIETLSSLHDSLQSIKDGIIPAYATKTGLSETRISNMMTKETWMSAREAVDLGFADSVITGGQGAKAQITNMAFVNMLKTYQNTPENIFTQQMESGMTSSMKNVIEACEACTNYCVECLHQCESCPNTADATHQATMATLKQCIEACTVCMHDCESGTASMAQLMASMQACMDLCVQCQADCRTCADACQYCNAACSLCADACQFCGSVCKSGMGTDGNSQPMNSSLKNQADIERAAQLKGLREKIQAIRSKEHE